MNTNYIQYSLGGVSGGTQTPFTLGVTYPCPSAQAWIWAGQGLPTHTPGASRVKEGAVWTYPLITMLVTPSMGQK